VRPLIVDLGKDYRGGQHQALLLCEGLKARGHDPELVTLRGSALARHAKDAGLGVCEVPAGRPRFAAALKIRRRVRGGRAEIVHANEPHALTAAWVARAHRSVPLVVSRRVALPLSRSPVALARYRAAARIIAVSHCVERHVLASGFPPRDVEVIYDGVEIPAEISRAERDAARSLLGISPKSSCIGNAAALVPRKGQALLLHAFAKLRGTFPGSVLLLWGEGPDRPTLEQLARELHIAEDVKFLGTEVSIESAFAAMDAFAFPSHMEALGTALLAAMARGLPVVAAARDGMTEVVEDGKSGLLVKEVDPGAFAAAIERLLSHLGEAKDLAHAARETALARFSAGRMVDETLRLYELLVTGDS
jgi:glycosyltransferase involved in cell wall biosynthesis